MSTVAPLPLAPVRRERSILALASAGVIASALCVALAWHDVVPGGWRLRGLVQSHAARDAALRASHRATRLAEFAREVAPTGAVVFLGSSTIERFPLADAFPSVTCLDRGIGDEPLPALLERLAASLPAAPAGLVLYTGSVDVRRLARPAVDVARDAAALCDALAARCPGVPVAWLGVLPDRTMSPAVAARVRDTNAAFAALAERRGITFVPTQRAPLLDSGGHLSRAHSADELHLSERGYEALAEWLRASFAPLAAR